MQKKPSITPTQFDNAVIISNIRELISASQLNVAPGTNLPNVSQLSKLKVTQDNIPQMRELCNELTKIQRKFVEGIEYTISNTTTNKTVRDTAVEDKLSKAEPFTRALKQFKQKIDAKIKEVLDALPPASGLDEEKIAKIKNAPAMMVQENLAQAPINHNTIKVDLSNVANTHNTVINSTVINNQGTKTIQDAKIARQAPQYHKNKNACCTIF